MIPFTFLLSLLLGRWVEFRPFGKTNAREVK